MLDRMTLADHVRAREDQWAAFAEASRGHYALESLYRWCTAENGKLFRGDTTRAALRGWSLTERYAYGPS